MIKTINTGNGTEVHTLWENHADDILASAPYIEKLPADASSEVQFLVLSTHHYCIKNGMSNDEYGRLFDEGMQTGDFANLQRRLLTMSIYYCERTLPTLGQSTEASAVQGMLSIDKQALQDLNGATPYRVPLSALSPTSMREEADWLTAMRQSGTQGEPVSPRAVITYLRQTQAAAPEDDVVLDTGRQRTHADLQQSANAQNTNDSVQ